MPALPKVPKGFITNFPGLVPDFIGPKQFIFLLCWVAVFTISLFFFDSTFFGGGVFKRTQSVIDSAEINSLAASALSPSAQRIYGYQAKSMKDNETYEGYVSLYQTVFGDYLSFGTVNSRLLLEAISATASDNYPAQYKNYDFVIPCLDDKCSQLEPDPKIGKIIDGIEKIEGVREDKLLVINRLKSLRYYDKVDPSLAFLIYNETFKSLVNFYNSTGNNPEIKTEIDKYIKVIAVKFPEQFNELKSLPGLNYYEY